VIGGGVVSAWEAFSPYVFEEATRRSFVYRATAPEDTGHIVPGKTIITRSLLGSDAGLFGAARLPMPVKKTPVEKTLHEKARTRLKQRKRD